MTSLTNGWLRQSRGGSLTSAASQNLNSTRNDYQIRDVSNSHVLPNGQPRTPLNTDGVTTNMNWRIKMIASNFSTSPSKATRCAVYAWSGSWIQPCSYTTADQINKCREAAQEKEWVVVEDYIRTDRGKSRTSLQGRSGIQELLVSTVTRPCSFDYLICSSSDRLGRDPRFVGPIIGTLGNL